MAYNLNTSYDPLKTAYLQFHSQATHINLFILQSSQHTEQNDAYWKISIDIRLEFLAVAFVGVAIRLNLKINSSKFLY